MNGIGRIINYFGGGPNDFSDKYNLSIYEGEISEGKAHGFGRLIYGIIGNFYIGYFNEDKFQG